ACTIFVVRSLRLRFLGLSRAPLAAFWSRFPNDTRRVGVEVKRITLSHHRQTVEKRFVVAVLKKYLAPVVASGHHVIEQSLCMDSGMSGHKALISKLVDLGKSDTVKLLLSTSRIAPSKI